MKLAFQVGKLIEESEQEWPEEGRRQYHGNSRLTLRLGVDFVGVPYNLLGLKLLSGVGSQMRYSAEFIPRAAQ